MGVDKPNRTTPLFIDMEIATELLGRSHGEFLSLPKIDRKKLRLYYKARYQKELEIEKRRRMELDKMRMKKEG